MTGPQTANTQAWDRYGSHHLRKKTAAPPIPDTIRWAFGTAGPGTEVLGPLAGRRVLELGCGTGRYAAHLAHHHHAHVTGVESSLAQYQRAVSFYGSVPGLTLVRADAVDYLQQADTFDVIISIHGALCFTPPSLLLPGVFTTLRPGGLLAASVLHTNYRGHGPSQTVEPSPQRLQITGQAPDTVYRWVLTPTLWRRLLAEHGLAVTSVDHINSDADDDPTSCCLIRATRDQR
ncbi:class I SAM-dependent methyltransferase [Streptosporangium sp. CA-115845]|uniref:class I SAM-dependent methyltransferase n=1 Tax=Streptosporangium sp. CA-115845 TaxID=3240071 RepID=UPI003D929062